MTDDFQALINRYRARMTVLREAFERDGCLHAISQRDPSYAILLTRNGSSDAPYRVTSFRDGEPVGHREYDLLEGGSPIQRAFQEFASEGMVLTVPSVLPPDRNSGCCPSGYDAGARVECGR
jgi:hypothetical protein